MSNSVRPDRQPPTRLPRPWDSPGKNTGLGCHFLFLCMKVKSESEVAQSCPTLSDPMDRILPDSPIHGIFQERVLECGAIAFSEECSNYHTIALISHTSKVMLKILQSQASAICEPWTSRCSCWFSKRQRNQRSNCQHLLDHGKSKRVPEKHLFLLYWLCQSLWLCGSL